MLQKRIDILEERTDSLKAKIDDLKRKQIHLCYIRDHDNKKHQIILLSYYKKVEGKTNSNHEHMHCL